MSSIAAAAGITAVVAALGKAAGAAMDFAKASVQTYASFEQIENGLSGVLGSAEKGKEFFEDMRSFSFETTFGVDTLSSAATQLLNIGIAANKVKPSLKMLGDVAGGDTNKFNELVGIFAKIQNTGKASSIQLQQLALRGVPIYQMLKEMGVEGTASADDITHAFEKMTTAFDEATGKAGVFYNNMQRINDTIQGRESFVSDTYRETLAGFAEAAGLASAYKAILDLVYGALQGIVNLLATINSNPVYQALFRGVLVGGITAIAVAVGGPLLAALKATVVQLGLIKALTTAISPVALAAGITAVAAGAGVALYSLAKNAYDTSTAQTELQKKLSELTRTQKEYNITLSEGTIILKGQTVEIANQVYELQNLADAYDRVKEKDYKKEGKQLKKLVSTETIVGLKDVAMGDKLAQHYLTDASANYYHALEEYMEYLQDEGETGENTQYWKQKLEEAGKELNRIKYAVSDVLDTQGKINRAEEEHLQLLNEEQKAQEAYKNNLAKIEAMYAQTDEGKKWADEKELKELKEMLDMIESFDQRPAMKANLAQQKIFTKPEGSPDAGKEYLGFGGKMDEEHVNMLKAYYAERQKEFDEKYNGKAKDTAKELSSWQTVMKGLFNFSDQDVTKFLDTGIHGLEEYSRRVKEEADALAPYWDSITGNDKTESAYNAEKAKAILDENKKVLQTLLSARDEKTGKLIWNDKKDENGNVIEDKSITQAKQNIADAQKAYDDANREAVFEAEYEALKKQGEQIGLDARHMAIYEAEAKKLEHTQAEALADLKGEQEYLKKLLDIEKQNNRMGKTRVQLTMQTLMEEKGITKEKAEQLAIAQEEADKRQRLAEATYLDDKYSEMVRVAAEGYNSEENGRKNFDAGSYAKGKAGQAAMGLIQGSDVGNFVEGFQQGGIWGAIINTLINAIAKVIGSLDGLELALNPITELLTGFKPMFQALLVPAIYTSKVLGMLGQALFKVVDFLSFGLFSKLSVHYESLVSSTSELNSLQKDEAERLKALNEQYRSLQSAIDEQNQYYLRKKMEVNAQAYDRALSSTSVNDMILTPQGNFSTDPNDYIIATKNPQSLGGGNTILQMNVKINNTIANTADVRTVQTTNADGMPELTVMISRKIAGDAASGANGWDDAFNAREQRLSGRRVTA